MSKSPNPTAGRCFCEEIKFEIRGEFRGVFACHCRNCQRLSGGAFQIWALFNPNDLSITSGKPKDISATEKTVRQFCATCGSHLFFKCSNRDDLMYVAVTTLENPHLKPDRHVWTNRKIEWLSLSDGIEVRE